MFGVKRRKTPWDEVSLTSAEVGDHELSHANMSPPAEQPSPEDFIRLRGVYQFHPTRSTNAEFRRFLWAGLSMLRAEAKARGWSQEQIRRALATSFDLVYDAGESTWAVLRRLTALSEHEPQEPTRSEMSSQPAVPEAELAQEHPALAAMERTRRRRAAMTQARFSALDEELRTLED